MDDDRPLSRLSIAIGIYRLLPRGGLEDNCIRIADELTRRGHLVTLFVAGPYPALPLRIVSLTPNVKPLFNHSRVSRFARDFAQATRSGFDRTLAFQPVPGADVLFIADWIRNRRHTPLWRRLTPRFRAYAGLEERCFAPRAGTRIIGLSEAQIVAYRERYGTAAERIAILPPTLAHEKRRPERRTAKVRERIRAEFGLAPSTTIWLWLGLQPTVKGLDRVLAALALHSDAHLLVGGFLGSERKVRAIRALARRRRIAERIHWLGYVSGDRLLDCIAAADALSHPARVDVTGGVILEAIVNGLPVVASSICGFAEHVTKSGAGKVVGEPFDPSEFSAAMGEVCGPRNAEYSAAGVAFGAVAELYSGTSRACDLIEASSWPLEEPAPELPAEAAAGPRIRLVSETGTPRRSLSRKFPS